ncbi:DUF3380 domain-containing protein [Spirosoma sp. HMF4905]|uniref:DUF3380 domain-containing protein n=1 Tax=Spirosoma arboris TaxID=2682092 RepID=A0A7K1SKK1_9BACT|nr:N-acetylmuramidase family protein [Spirosoma arboris]MVM34243.1 DUF3380 domain-containing protein [Spirosoma arboris]
MPNPIFVQPRLTLNDFQNAAELLSTGVAEVKAVTEVESGGRGFDLTNRVIIRFEPHVFHRYTKGAYDISHPLLSYPVWQPGYPKNLDHSWRLFTEASALDYNAAVMATSFGLFQIMGFNFSACGCKTVSEFVAAMKQSEGEQLRLFVEFVKSRDLDDELKSHNWASFARQYNGAGYKANQYDTKLADAFKRFSVK